MVQKKLSKLRQKLKKKKNSLNHKLSAYIGYYQECARCGWSDDTIEPNTECPNCSSKKIKTKMSERIMGAFEVEDEDYANELIVGKTYQVEE